MIWIPIGLASLTMMAALTAAIYWFRSSRVKIPDYETVVVAKYEPALNNAMREVARRNKWAAIWTGVASVLGAASAVASVLI